MKKTKDTNYNGWVNYETWVINLWLGNDQATYRECERLILEAIEENEGQDRATIEQELAKGLRGWLENENPLEGPQRQANVYTDLLGKALNNVDWLELARAYIEGYEGELE